MERYSPDATPVKVSVPGNSYARLMSVCRALGHSKRGERWKLLDMLLAYAEAHPRGGTGLYLCERSELEADSRKRLAIRRIGAVQAPNDQPPTMTALQSQYPVRGGPSGGSGLKFASLTQVRRTCATQRFPRRKCSTTRLPLQ